MSDKDRLRVLRVIDGETGYLVFGREKRRNRGCSRGFGGWKRVQLLIGPTKVNDRGPCVNCAGIRFDWKGKFLNLEYTKD